MVDIPFESLALELGDAGHEDGVASRDGVVDCLGDRLADAVVVIPPIEVPGVNSAPWDEDGGLDIPVSSCIGAEHRHLEDWRDLPRRGTARREERGCAFWVVGRQDNSEKHTLCISKMYQIKTKK